MVKVILICFGFLLLSCGINTSITNNKSNNDTKDSVDSNEVISILGPVNFDDNNSLSKYSAILKNVQGDKEGAYIGHKMDRLAVSIENKLNYTELLRVAEGLILEFDTNSGLYFYTGKKKLNNTSKETLSLLYTILNDFPNINLIFEVHTDSAGEEDVNLTLTQNRAETIRDYLVNSGMDKNRILINFFGETKPKYDGDNVENRLKNRRIEFGFFASDALKKEAKNYTK